MAKARAQNNLIQRLTQSEVPLYCHMMPFAEKGTGDCTEAEVAVQGMGVVGAG